MLDTCWTTNKNPSETDELNERNLDLYLSRQNDGVRYKKKCILRQ